MCLSVSVTTLEARSVTTDASNPDGNDDSVTPDVSADVDSPTDLKESNK